MLYKAKCLHSSGGEARIMLSEKSVPDKQNTNGKSLLQAIGKSLYDSIGDIVFGMEDGTFSIFGLVFGVASSTSSSSVVLLAGATGAISAAVSMMAGTFLDVESTNDQVKAQLAQEQKEIENNLEQKSRKSGTDSELPAFMTRIQRRSSKRWPATPKHCSRSRQPLNCISGVRNRRIRVLTALETLGIAAAAALAGFLIGRLVTRTR